MLCLARVGTPLTALPEAHARRRDKGTNPAPARDVGCEFTLGTPLPAGALHP
jgi:hypothetical protein